MGLVSYRIAASLGGERRPSGHQPWSRGSGRVSVSVRIRVRVRARVEGVPVVVHPLDQVDLGLRLVADHGRVVVLARDHVEVVP